MKIAMASDHGGLQLKKEIIKYLTESGHEIEDFGTYTTDSCDYPDYGSQAAWAVSKGICERGIVVCTTGIGMSIVANKVSNVRCALCTSVDMATMTRKHNNANVLALGQKYVTFKLAKSIVDAFLSTEFEGGRHELRVEKIENDKCKMLIKLDDDKIERIGKYDKDKMWGVIDDLCEEHFLIKKEYPDGTRIYYGDEINRPTKQFADISLCYMYLRDQDWFASSVKQWIWYESNGCKNDLVYSQLQKNPQFKKAYDL